ncbi:MAG TPA: hypothetical protein PK725_16160 [Rhodocyclaceae bacterium]|uniref:hypothetical protein n=1 Tax=Thauera sp. TaxID=1905334 RepID=UPI002D1403AC|nr:hypothetical protein [Thauera sp.]HRP26624.1 hypothetical protein [Thauera sp.]HRQ48490.1 hypothetical protein [Rhodocyclaceae bacterium]
MAEVRQQCAGHLPFGRHATASVRFSVLRTGTTDPEPPLEHSEDLIEQDEGSQCSTDSIPSMAPAAQRAPFADYLHHAHRHCKIIERLGCFSD